VVDGAGDLTEDGDEVGVRVGVGVGAGLAFRDGCGEPTVGLGLVGATVGVWLAGVTVGWAVVWLFTGELVAAGVGLTQR
jgi:hypothetical protein